VLPTSWQLASFVVTVMFADGQVVVVVVLQRWMHPPLHVVVDIVLHAGKVPMQDHGGVAELMLDTFTMQVALEFCQVS